MLLRTAIAPLTARTCVRGLASAGAWTGPGSLVTFEVDEATRVGTITLNDAPRLNALTEAMGDELVGLVRHLRKDCDAVGAVVVRGAGKAFSAGGDLDFLRRRHADTGSRNAELMRAFYERFLSIRTLPVPVVSAIHGAAIGAGLCFAVAADYTLAASTAQMGVTFVRLGLHPGMGTTHFLPRLVGPHLAARLALTGEVMSGEEAARLRLVGECVRGPEDLWRAVDAAGSDKEQQKQARQALEAAEKELVLARARSLATSMARAAPVAVRACVRSLRMQTDEALDRSLWREADAQCYSYASPDLGAGVEGVASKTTPTFAQYEAYHDKP
jgi:enoyl-CoA hydratase/carnithine racemase